MEWGCAALPSGENISGALWGEMWVSKGHEMVSLGAGDPVLAVMLVLGACSCHLAPLQSHVFLVQNNRLPLPLVLFQMRPVPRSVGSLFTASLASADP